jgi:hypothetical protein
MKTGPVSETCFVPNDIGRSKSGNPVNLECITSLSDSFRTEEYLWFTNGPVDVRERRTDSFAVDLFADLSKLNVFQSEL